MTSYDEQAGPDLAPTTAVEDDELYVGYLPAAPPGYARFVRRLVWALLAGTAALALLLAALQGPFDPGTFELGREHATSGVVRARPAPVLVADADDPGNAPRAALLVRPFKHGAHAEAAAFDGHRVSLRAHRVTGPRGEMLELVPGSIVDGGESGAPPRRESLGRFRLRGELVDSKCYLGVMKPGRGKPHRGCAARCLSGGIPPLLLVEDQAGERVGLVVTTRDGSALPRTVLDRVGEAITLEGEVERIDGVLALILAALPAP